MDSAKQTAASGFLAPEGESKKKRERATVKGNRIRGEKKAIEVASGFHGI